VSENIHSTLSLVFGLAHCPFSAFQRALSLFHSILAQTQDDSPLSLHFRIAMASNIHIGTPNNLYASTGLTLYIYGNFDGNVS
jgi:hypothetical protein